MLLDENENETFTSISAQFIAKTITNATTSGYLALSSILSFILI